MFKIGTIIKIKNAESFCGGVYNNKIAKIIDYALFSSSYYIDLLKKEDIEYVHRTVFAATRTIIPSIYCFSWGEKLKI